MRIVVRFLFAFTLVLSGCASGFDSRTSSECDGDDLVRDLDLPTASVEIAGLSSDLTAPHWNLEVNNESARTPLDAEFGTSCFQFLLAAQPPDPRLGFVVSVVTRRSEPDAIAMFRGMRTWVRNPVAFPTESDVLVRQEADRDFECLSEFDESAGTCSSLIVHGTTGRRYVSLSLPNVDLDTADEVYDLVLAAIRPSTP